MNYKKVVSICFILSFVFLFSFAAQAEIDWLTKLNSGADKTGIYQTNTDTSQSAAAIARYTGAVLSIGAFLGFIFIIQIVIAGYEWMTARGNEEKIEKSQKRIMYATIGIIILAGLYAVANFFISQLGGATGYKIGG
ncbi:hypothetical protein COV49_04155 [Candidatus Falkowbacteria bacterium CG11_big_fil_rev_8_21_14_0_20_39_10]|uniref:Uncharacterized protein n=1 Tax=Candidatus Falkowbacteria bacterium CG11_big_fil_rev_8_21_14_0_20_39_10 TaxID=1974570 RepID=A0A2M6K832_9BACT|nr:MAG: hypothetical protein COV49_04155 [Candidatus Falkowbacteria bacterium CG11_big_fil_rev_8_21_14_0_20_39_10]